MPSSSAAEELGDSPKPVLGESFWTTFPTLVMRATWIIVILSILTQLFTVILESRSPVDLIGLAVMNVGVAVSWFLGVRLGIWFICAAPLLVGLLGGLPVGLWSVGCFMALILTLRGDSALFVGLTIAAAAYCSEGFAEHAWLPMEDPIPAIAGGAALLMAALGSTFRSQQLYWWEVEKRAADVVRSRAEEVRRRVVEERLRIARDLHDSVGHSIALANMQLNAADVTLPPDATASSTAIENAQSTLHQALTDMQQLLAVLREDSADDVAAANVLPATGEGVTTAVVIPGSSSQTVETEDLVNNLRENVIPSATAGSDLRVYVGGETASNIDLSQALMNKLPLYLGLIAVLGFLLLTIAFRSVVIPLIGALSNLLTIAVGLGCITAIFQFGWGSQVLGVGSGAPIMYIVPVILMGVVFGLSMDYQVFLVSRMHEEWTMHKNNQRAVRVGVSETAPVIITAASIMLCVFASFAFTSERIIASMGIGLALSVLTDALIVRLVVIPSFMNMLGNANWWFPGKRSNRHPATVHPTPLESGADAAEDLVPAAV